MGFKDLTDLLKVGGSVADNLITTSEERQAQISARHNIDMMSDSMLSKNVRPIAFLSSLFFFFIILIAQIVLAFMEKDLIDSVIFGTVAGLTGTYGSFYFYRRSTEKIAFKNAQANVELEQVRVKHEQKMEKRLAKTKRREARRETT